MRVGGTGGGWEMEWRGRKREEKRRENRKERGGEVKDDYTMHHQHIPYFIPWLGTFMSD